MDLAKEAVRYAKLGLAVFPLAPGTKMPPKGTNGVKMATTNTEGFEINWKSHNIGVATGQVSGNIVVIDCDNDELSGKDGYGTVRAYLSENKITSTNIIRAIMSRNYIIINYNS